VTIADERESRLLATMINVLVAALSDPNRLSRGRTYARQGAVEDLDVRPGIVTGSVQGSRSQPYEVAVRVTAAESFDTMTALVPDRRDIRFSCSCPDWDDPCKHAVAVMITFAAFVADDPEALRLWRGKVPDGPTGRAVVGSRVGSMSPFEAPADPRASLDPASLDPAAVAELRAYLGEATEYSTGEVSRLAPPNAAWGELWAEMLTDALDRLTRGS
jgi:SWIM zinc finger